MSGGKIEEIIDIPDEEADDMNGVEYEEYLDQLSRDFMNNHVDFGYEVLDD
jgi:hypothetical protein